MTPLACICPQEIAAANHKIKTAAWWRGGDCGE